MTFVKYPKIKEPTSKMVSRYRRQDPNLDNMTWYMQEKFDGANIQIYYDGSEHEPRLGKRSGFVTEDDNFFNLHSVYLHQRDQIDALADEITSGPVRLFGEIYGPGIQNRIDYGNEKKIVIFDAMWQPFEEEESVDPGVMQVFQEYFPDLIVPFQEVDYKTMDDFQNIQIPDGIEGYVLKPAMVKLDGGTNTPIMFKVKHEKFSEKENKNPKPKKQDNLSEEANTLREQFIGYINDNRLKSVFSHHGEIEDASQIGSYIKLVMEDAKEDFFEDYGDQFKNLDKKEQGKIMNVGNQIVPLLKEYL